MVSEGHHGKTAPSRGLRAKRRQSGDSLLADARLGMNMGYGQGMCAAAKRPCAPAFTDVLQICRVQPFSLRSRFIDAPPEADALALARDTIAKSELAPTEAALRSRASGCTPQRPAFSDALPRFAKALSAPPRRRSTQGHVGGFQA